ncbi:MAG: hypothetical protein VXW76_06350 [Actinomycetota bacterium]|nr:hypothetical protein [Actinomycetota bacterium]
MDRIYREAKLTPEEIAQMSGFIEGKGEFYLSTAYEKLFEYFAFESGEMPYLVAKARTETPDEWILERLEQ